MLNSIKKTQQNCTTFLYNEILPPINEKQKVLDANERSVYQFLELLDEIAENKPKSYRQTAKSHATMFPKKFIPLYLEDLRFLIKRAGWIVTKLYPNFVFEQDCFKKDFSALQPKIETERQK